MLRTVFGDRLVALFTTLAILGFSASIMAIVFAVRECSARETFAERCAAACYPNTVYDTKYNRCTCNASVTIREVK